MPRWIVTVCVLGLLILCLAGSDWLAAQAPSAAPQEGRGGGGAAAPPPPRQEPQRSTRITFPPLLWREDWKYDYSQPNVNRPDEPEHPVVQGDVGNPNLEVRTYGHKEGVWMVDQAFNDHMMYVMTLLCESNCALTLRDKNNYMDLSGVATLRWRTRVSGFHFLRPIIKLADGRWLVGDKGVPGPQTAWAVSEIQMVDVRWRNLDIERVVEARDGYWVDYPDLTRVDEIGFTDLMRGSGHGSGGGSRVDWIEVYGRPVPRGASSTQRSGQ